MQTLTDKQTDLIRTLIDAGFGLCRPIIPAVHVEPGKRLMLYGLERKGALDSHKTEFNGTVFTPTQLAFDLVRSLKEAEERKRLAELEGIARNRLMTALYAEGHQLRCVRKDGWTAGVRPIDRRHEQTSYSVFRPRNVIAADTVEQFTCPTLLWQMEQFAPLRTWQVV